MEILWLAIAFYSIGLAGVLYFRPSMMFHENGAWKEFGYQRDSRHTMFPFWLFAVVWAFVSYTLAAASVWSSGAALAATAVPWLRESRESRESSGPSYDESESEIEVEEAEAEAEAESEAEAEAELEESMPEIRVSELPKRKATMKKDKKPRPGYYVLNADSKNSGLRKYIYYGQKPPKN